VFDVLDEHWYAVKGSRWTCRAASQIEVRRLGERIVRTQVDYSSKVYVALTDAAQALLEGIDCGRSA